MKGGDIVGIEKLKQEAPEVFDRVKDDYLMHKMVLDELRRGVRGDKALSLATGLKLEVVNRIVDNLMLFEALRLDDQLKL